MKKQFIPYDIALELKDLGFDEPCFAWTMVGNEDFIISPIEKYGTEERKKQSLQIPTWQQAFRYLYYLLEKYNININCRIEVTHYGWDFLILDDDDDVLYAYVDKNALLKLIEIIKN